MHAWLSVRFACRLHGWIHHFFGGVQRWSKMMFRDENPRSFFVPMLGCSCSASHSFSDVSRSQGFEGPDDLHLQNSPTAGGAASQGGAMLYVVPLLVLIVALIYNFVLV